MPYRSPARYLAPLAIVGVLIALVVVYTATIGGDETPAPQSAGSETSTQTTGTGTTSTAAPGARTSTASDGDGGGEQETVREGGRTYTVQSGDILSVIAEEQGVPVERILELNPEVDPQSLQAGDELRLEP